MNYLSPDTYVLKIDNNTLGIWREYLKRELLFRRRYRSDWSGKLITLQTGCHLHEAILSRAVVPKSVWWHYKLHDERNCLLLLPDEHIPQPPSREWAIEYLYNKYGQDVIKEWYESLPFKSFPFQLP